MPRANEDEVVSATYALRGDDPVASAYSILDQVVAQHRLRDAWLVLHPPGLSAQVFRHDRRPAGGPEVKRLADRPTGLYGDPAIDPVASALIGACCEAAFSARALTGNTLTDAETSLLSRPAIELSLARAAAGAARHHWSTTAVLVTTAGAGEAERWPVLASAVRQALRSGDEAGVAAPGTALALLGNAGADAVRPFLARVRAELSAAGWDGADLLAAAATTPQESVDPDELWRLAGARLAELGVATPATAPGLTLELELRLLPAVASVGALRNGTGPAISVVRLGTETPGAEIEDAVRRHDPDLTVHVVTATAVDTAPSDLPHTAAPDGGPPPVHGSAYATAAQAAAQPVSAAARNGTAAGTTPPAAYAPATGDTGSAMTRPATLPGAGDGAGDGALDGAGEELRHGAGEELRHGANRAARVTLERAVFDPARGMSEVTLALGSVRGTGRAPAGALVGGAQATLVALGALGRTVPFYLVSAERARTIPGAPVVVVLAPRNDRAGADPSGERIGLANGESEVEAASRATLGALNRFLGRSAAPA